MVKTQGLYRTWSWNGIGTWQTPRRTDRQTDSKTTEDDWADWNQTTDARS